ncbi:MAG: Cell wall hydrolase/autolysin [Desulfotomaculum sp. 46_296]|nr:MAG: Cell wall hydrolase/autolysin [Desulfotomaculum sp. 46_296]KUK84854.1 MAG: Cell wall hydrolase/autolysin [Desulfofundulus kuznetsovii]
MTDQRFTQITNFWSDVFEKDGRQFSRVAIESTYPLSYQLSSSRANVKMLIKKARANINYSKTEVYDGLISELTVRQNEAENVTTEIALDYDAPFTVNFSEGIPARTFIVFDRMRLYDIFSPLKIVIDPGHGGDDKGGFGPVDLLEKNIALILAEQTKLYLDKYGAQTFLTRESDQKIPLRDRFNFALSNKADLFISLHTHYDKNPEVKGLFVGYNPAAASSEKLAWLIAVEVARKTKRDIREIRRDSHLTALKKIPGVIIEPVTISNYVEEGLLRNPHLYEKVALGIFNGIKGLFDG